MTIQNETRFASFLATLTIAQAVAWADSADQFLFVTDLLTANNFRRSDYAVDSVEHVFARLLGFAGVGDYDHYIETATERAFGC